MSAVRFIHIEREIAKEDRGLGSLDVKVIQCPSFLLGRTTCTTRPTYETANAVHLQKFHLLGSRYIHKNIRDEFGANAMLNSLKNTKTISDGGLAHI